MNKPNIITCLLPENKKEIYLLVLLMLFYFSYSVIIITQTCIIDHSGLLYDIYFSFDNSVIFRYGYESIQPHPLLKFITSPIIFIGDHAVTYTGILKVKTYIWCFISNYLIAGSVLFIFKYLKNILKLKCKIALLISITFAVTTTNLILSFTPESYPFSMYIITFTLYYIGWNIEKGTTVNFIEKVGIIVLAGGITITNSVICALPFLYLNEPLKKKIKELLVVAFIIGLIMCWIGLKYHFVANTRERMMYFGYIDGTLYEHIIDLFWSTPILASEVFIHNLSGVTIEVMSMACYHYWWQYAIIGVISILIFLSIVINYKVKHVQVLFLILSFNVLIHVVVKYGLNEPFLFAGHWIYIIPLLLGWLYKYSSKNIRALLTPVYICVCICLLFNNIYFLYNFIQTSIMMFPA